MSYTEEEIKKYLDILHNYKNPLVQKVSKKARCSNCPNTDFFTIENGYKICEECGTQNGHVLGLFDIKDLDRLQYKKKKYISKEIPL